MKKALVLMACALVATAFTGCNSKKSPGEVAKAHHEMLKNNNYNGYVDNIYVDETLLPVSVTPAQRDQYVRTVNQQNAQMLRQKVQPTLDARGGIKDVAVKSQNIAPDGRNANVTLTNTYNNGQMEDVTYALMMDNNDEWKVKMGPDKEVWRAVSTDGRHETIKLKDETNRQIMKDDADGNRDFVKVIQDGNREVTKVKEDGDRQVRKVIEKEDETVIKEKENGEKEVTRIPKE